DVKPLRACRPGCRLVVREGVVERRHRVGGLDAQLGDPARVDAGDSDLHPAVAAVPVEADVETVVSPIRQLHPLLVEGIPGHHCLLSFSCARTTIAARPSRGNGASMRLRVRLATPGSKSNGST